MRVINPLASSNRNSTLKSTYRAHEHTKKRAYEVRIREFEQSTLTPLILSTTGGMGTEATVFYKRLATMLAAKWGDHYSHVLCWLRCRHGFSLLRSSIQAIRGSRSSSGHPVRCSSFPTDLVRAEACFTST